MSNLEVLNATMIENNITQKERLEKLNLTAIKQINLLSSDKNINDISNLENKDKKLFIETK